MDIVSGEGFRHRVLTRENEVQWLIDNWKKAQPHRRIPVVVDSSSLQRAVGMRGARWYKQIYFCFVRSMVQQHRQRSSLFLEIFVGGFAGGLIGLAVLRADGNLFRGTNIAPFELVSSAVKVDLLPEICLMMGLAIGLAGAPSGVKVFGDESKPHAPPRRCARKANTLQSSYTGARRRQATRGGPTTWERLSRRCRGLPSRRFILPCF